MDTLVDYTCQSTNQSYLSGSSSQYTDVTLKHNNLSGGSLYAAPRCVTTARRASPGSTNQFPIPVGKSGENLGIKQNHGMWSDSCVSAMVNKHSNED